MFQRLTIPFICCVCVLTVFPQLCWGQTPHAAATKGMLPSEATVAAVCTYAATDVETESKKLGLATEKYVYETDEASALLLLPRNADSEIRLYKISYDETHNFEQQIEKTPFYTKAIPADAAFWLYLNFPDTSPTLRLCIYTAEKEHCFTPFISGQDGSLVVENGFVEVSQMP